MATWKKVIVSGSDAILNQVTASGGFSGDGSGLTGILADSLGNSLTDGNGIVDFTFNGSAGATVAVQVSGSTLEVGTNGVRVANSGITATQIATSVAGAGLSGGGGTALAVIVDDSSIEINVDTLRVKASGITNTMLAGSIANAKLANSAITIAGASTSLGGSITAAAIGTAIGAFSGSAQVTGITVDQMASNSVDTAQIAAGAVETAKIDDLAVTTAKIADNAVTGDKLSDDVTIANNLTVTGDLIVNGDTTTLSTTNLSIEDKFITIASGSTSATDGGLVVSKQANGAGFGFGYDTGTTRWAFDNDLAVNATGIVPDAWVGTVESHASAPPNPLSAPVYGGATNGYGTIYVVKNTGDIYIYA